MDTMSWATGLVRAGRVLRPKGVFFIVSYGIPDNRLQYLENEDYSWTVTVHTVRKCPDTHL